jgi:hypothetical protein
MTLDASGNLGVGITSPATKLHVAGSTGLTLGAISGDAWRTAAIAPIDEGSAFKGSLAFYTHPSAGSAGAPTERARIDSSGNLLVGTTTSGGQGGLSVYPNGSGTSVQLSFKKAADGVQNTAQVFFAGSTQVGSITYTNTATAFNTSSDYRLKNTIAPMTGALAKVALLKPCTYKWNADGSDGEGFIAHELAEVVPQCVTGEKDAVNEDGSIKPQGIDTSFLVATLTAAMQEQQAIIESLKARLDAANL